MAIPKPRDTSTPDLAIGETIITIYSLSFVFEWGPINLFLFFIAFSKTLYYNSDWRQIRYLIKEKLEF